MVMLYRLHMSNRVTIPKTRGASERATGSRDFRLYASGQAVSVMGDRVATIASVFLVVHLTRAYPPAVALFYLCRVLPTLLGGLIAGVLVDHFQRRRVMVVCDLGRAVLVGLVPLLTTFSTWTIFPVVFVLYALTLMSRTAARAAIPDVVPEGGMMAANSLLQVIDTGADLAYGIGGVLVLGLGLALPFYIDAVTFVVSAGTVLLMRMSQENAGPLPSARATLLRIRDGISYLLNNPFLRWSTVTFLFAPMAGGAEYVVAPLFASRTLARSPGLIGPLRSPAFRFAVLEMCLGGGLVLGAALAPRLARRFPRGKLFGAGVTGMGIAIGFLSVSHDLFSAGALLAVAGACNMVFIVSGTTLVQVLTPSNVRGRVMGARFTVVNGALALGSALGGLLLLSVSLSAAWAILGAVIALSSLCIWLIPEVRGQV
jgi:predicted MFS family arabinose efflux permease